MLEPAPCRRRQQRLCRRLTDLKLDCAVVGHRPNAYWLSGVWPFWLSESAVVLWADGKAELVAPEGVSQPASVDALHPYVAKRNATQRMDQPAAVAETLQSILGAKKRVGVDASPIAVCLAAMGATTISIDAELHQLRRRKEPDELALMKKAIACTEAMHRRAREIVRPGVQELDVFLELHATAVRTAGEPLSPAYLGNDFASGPSGGVPRNNRPARDGEIYVLDLGPAYRGYFADNCRAYAVNGRPTEPQTKAWTSIMGVFPLIERMARPGVRCRDLFAAADQHLRQTYGNALIHHLGHGVGLFPHEYPHLNPEWDDVLEVGDVFTAEPGLYGDEINGGIRLENQYVVTENGVENLTPFPMDL